MRKKIRKFHIHFRKTHATKILALKRLREHPVMIPVVLFVALVAISTTALLILNGGSPKFKPIDSFIVIISHDHVEQTVPTRESTIGALLSKLNIKINQGDVVEPSPATPITQNDFRINIYRAVPVEIVDGGHTTLSFSAAATPRAVVQQAGLTVYPEDNVSKVPVANFASQQTVSEQVIIDPATPVGLNLYGVQTVIRTHAKTVADLLVDKGIKLGQGDSIEPSLPTPLTPNTQVFLLHQGIKIQTVEQSIPTPIQTIQDNSLTFGTSAVRQQGSPGQEILTYQLNMVNGVTVSQTLIQTVVTISPVPQIVAQGQAVQIPSDITAVMSQAGISSSDYAYVNYIMSREGGWCPTKWQGEHNCPAYYQPLYSESNGPGYGIGQATPADKMAAFGGDWRTNVVTQLKWATSYADGRYGSWGAAYNHWQAYSNW